MPELLVLLGDQIVNRYVFDKDVISIGRSRDNDVVIENLAVSRNHCRIRRKNANYILTDLNSANGTEVNGVAVTKTELQHEDVVTIGKHRIVFKNEPMTDEALISDAFGAERTMIVDQAPVAYLLVTRGKQKDLEFRVDKAEVTIGRSSDCDLCLHDWFVSKRHAVIYREGNSFLLRDSGSWRGTKVNDAQVTEAVLHDGDAIQIGGTRLSFRFVPESERSKPTGRIPLELGPGDSALFDRDAAPEKTPVAAAGDWEEPILAGGEDDFIEPSTVAQAEEKTLEKGEFDDLDEELRDSAEMIRDVISTPIPVDVSEELEQQAQRRIEEAAERVGAEEAVTAVPEGQAGERIVEPQEVGPDEEAQIVRDQPEVESQPAAVEEPERPQPEEGPAVEKRAEPEETEAPGEATAQPSEMAAPEKPAAPETIEEEILLWEVALKNKSPVIRAEAARMLKKLTGKDYDY